MQLNNYSEHESFNFGALSANVLQGGSHSDLLSHCVITGELPELESEQPSEMSETSTILLQAHSSKSDFSNSITLEGTPKNSLSRNSNAEVCKNTESTKTSAISSKQYAKLRGISAHQKKQLAALRLRLTNLKKSLWEHHLENDYLQDLLRVSAISETAAALSVVRYSNSNNRMIRPAVFKKRTKKNCNCNCLCYKYCGS